MIHKIKGLYDQGRGMSIRSISNELSISRNTVRKYLRMDEPAISLAQDDRSRAKRMDRYREFLVHQLSRYPKLSAVKLMRRLQDRVGDLDVSARSLRRYVQALKEQVATGQLRYYEPVAQLVPGIQCQVDPGELRGVLVCGEQRTVHFVVFVLSCSRLMYVGVAFRPLDTAAFIELHDQAMRYFGGVTEECVYDQTKLVVISEQYREIIVNARFQEYATYAGFRIHACEGYDPESKGKVEAGVKYVKTDCLYGEEFVSEQALREHVAQWLDTIANTREHGTTGRIPREHFEAEERVQLRAYKVSPVVASRMATLQRRRADKTGLISWKSNKYSVPMAWQQAPVGVAEHDDGLSIMDLKTGEVIAIHRVSLERGQLVKNNHHYRDHAQRIVDLEADIAALLNQDLGRALCGVIKRTSPRIYKDQLVAVRALLRSNTPINEDLLTSLSRRPELTASGLRRYLEASDCARRRGRIIDELTGTQDAPLDLAAYAHVGHPVGQEVCHESA